MPIPLVRPERKRHRYHGGQGRKALLEIAKRNLAHDAAHQIADNYERSGRGLRWHNSRQRTEKQRQKEPACRYEGSEAGAPTDGDTCGALNVGGGRAGGSHTSKDSPQRIYQEHTIDAREADRVRPAICPHHQHRSPFPSCRKNLTA